MSFGNGPDLLAGSLMDEVEEQTLSAFDRYLKSLPEDALLLLDVVCDENQPEDMRRILAGGLNYLFKSLDLIDDGIEGLGYLDDAFVLRYVVGRAKEAGALPDALAALAQEAEVVTLVLGDLSGRFYRFVSSLSDSVVRGRSVEAIVTDPVVCDELRGELAAWASRYEVPHFVADERGVIKLRAFLDAKLPE